MAVFPFAEKVAAASSERGCSAFGHSCYGGHGKRFDPHLRDNVLQGNEPSTDDRSEKTETLSLSNDFVRPEQKFGGQPEILFPQMRRQDSSRFDPYTLSFIVRQWLTLHHRLHQPDAELNNK
ncbi:PREDICTED: uncharacterized protein LOC108572631 [Habropoda laboriosa]|uniref:uncharacterized protein LOC108572631 n=1 Tax=Habropoda laboriosa TaxID=597456 RepID=UPI00083D192A|nr:PREDICTED: uncharacterized protein LOC108572631 [Habropoda laboriosa]